MKPATPIQFVRSFHRWSGVLLILLIGLKMISGFNAAGQIQWMPVSLAYRLHYAVWIDIPLMFLFIAHAFYGLYKMVQTQKTNRVSLFWWTNGIILLVFALSALAFYLF